MASVKRETYTGTRITFSTPSPFEEVIERLNTSIHNPSSPSWSEVASAIKPSSPSFNAAAFTTLIQSALGRHDFMKFNEFDHGSWVPLFGVGDGRRAKRIVLGNPLIAITMLKHDMGAGLYVPVELLVLESENKGTTDVVYQLPSGLIAEGRGSEELMAAAQVLDGKLEKLVESIVGP